jgi:tetratricopeptide (TPR) repeat protein
MIAMINYLVTASDNSPEFLMEQQEYLSAIELLKSIIYSQPDSDHLAMLGLAYFHTEQYELSAANYEKALKLNPSNKNWQEMWQHARSNAISEVNIPVPEVYYFDRERLLSKPVVPEGSLPSTPVPAPPKPGLLKRIKVALGNGIGGVATVTTELVTTAYGKLAGYTGEVWTNWYRRPLLLGILTLAYMREKINAHNLKSTYPKNTLVGFQPEGQTPPEGAKYFRTADGSWNNLNNPKEGAAGTRFSRNVSVDSIKPETGDRLLTPNPRELSRHLLTRSDGMKEIPFLNLLAASWIQFENHDWINHGENALNELIEIPLAEDDPARKKFWQTKMLVPKTQPDPTRMNGKEEAPVSFINEVTHWWDGSQIYGSDQQTIDRLRSGVDGKLKINEDGTLPVGKKGIEETGFVRNWWIGLSMLHTLFTREHNAICDHLKEHYPGWDDSKLFNVARLINAAITAKIHSVEWTPAILANKALGLALY